MKKRLITYFLLLMLPALAWAGRVPERVARQQAAAFMQERWGDSRLMPRRVAPKGQAETEAAADTPYYIYNCDGARGFVVVSGDDRTEAILGYADEGSYDENEVPDAMRQWLDGLAEEMAQLDMMGIDVPLLMAPTATHTAIAPLLKSKWGQNAPFNCELPTDPSTGNPSLVGCVGTAMAQVVGYYRYPSATTATIPAYTTGTREIDMEAIDPTAIDWNDIVNVYDASSSEVQKKAVGTLMKLCANAVRMDYRSTSSSASTANMTGALIAYFGYDPAMRYITRASYTAAEWDNIIYNELSARRPVVCRATRDRNGSDSSHAFIIDGYDGNGLYHLNWGWAGSYNGYFLLSVLSPYETSESGQHYDNEGYTIDQEAIIGIQPDAGGEPAPGLLTARGITLNGATTMTRTSSDRNFTGIKLTSAFYNFTGLTRTFDQGIGAWDMAGNLVACQTTGTNRKLDNNYGSRAFESSYDFGANLPDGKYRIVNISRESGSGSEWQADINSEANYIWAEISGNTLTLGPMRAFLEGSISTIGKTEAGALVKLTARVENTDADFRGMVYLFVDGTRKGGRYIELAKGETADVEMGFTPTAAGMCTLQLGTTTNDGYDYFAETSVNVSAAAASSLTLTLAGTNADSQKNVGTTLDISISARNDGSDRYDNRLRGMIYKLRTDGSRTGDLANRQEVDVVIEPGQTVVADFHFSGLDAGGQYFLYFYPFSEGTTDSNHRLYSGTYTVTQQATGIDLAPVHGDAVVGIRTADGQWVGTCRESELPTFAGQLPHAVYIVNGRKVVR